MNDNLQDQHSSAAVECPNRKGLDPLHMPIEGFSPSSGNNVASSETNPNCFELELKDLQTWLKKKMSASILPWMSSCFSPIPSLPHIPLLLIILILRFIFFSLSFKLFTEISSRTSCHHQSVCHAGISKNNAFFRVILDPQTFKQCPLCQQEVVKQKTDPPSFILCPNPLYYYEGSRIRKILHPKSGA